MGKISKQNPNEICWEEDRKTRYSNCNYCKHKDECERNPHGLMSEVMYDEGNLWE